MPELIGLGLLILALIRAGLSPLWVAIYWWNPLVVKELANSAHMDGLLVPLLAAAAVLVALPLLEAGLPPSSGFVAYGQTWQMNDAVFSLVLGVTEAIWDSSRAQTAARVVVLAVLAVIVVVLVIRPAKDSRETVWHLLILISPQSHRLFLVCRLARAVFGRFPGHAIATAECTSAALLSALRPGAPRVCRCLRPLCRVARIRPGLALVGRYGVAPLKDGLMRKGKSIAVIIPTLNESATVDAVIAHTPHWVDRIIVVDNGSRDQTVSYARRAGATVVTETRRGYGAACLSGLASARRRHLCLCRCRSFR